MPEQEGLEVIRDIRRAGQPMAIIAISGGGYPGGLNVLEIARELGANAALTKPFSREELVEAVEACLAANEPT